MCSRNAEQRAHHSALAPGLLWGRGVQLEEEVTGIAPTQAEAPATWKSMHSEVKAGLT